MDRIKNCAEKMEEVFGIAPVGSEGTDPEFMHILQRSIFGEVCYVGSADNRMRELITVTVLTVCQTLPQLKAHTAACLHVGVTPSEIREVVYQCAPFIGFPKTLNAIAAMNEVFAEKGISLPLAAVGSTSEEDRMRRGAELQTALYGGEIKDRYKWLPGDFAQAVPNWLTGVCFGDFATRGVLSEKDRELLTVVLLAALGGADMQVRAHVGGALKAGNTKEEVVCALFHAMPYMGVPRLFNALNCAKDILEEKKD